jgi:hypothetical protein
MSPKSYELKYGMTFSEFAVAWEKNDIPDRWSHSVERDYMEWEGLEAERKKQIQEVLEIYDL